MNTAKIGVILITLVLLSLACNNTTHAPTSTLTPGEKLISLQVESAGEPWGKKFMQGLSGRTSLEGGMLFDFQGTISAAFQMRETLIPLSIAFISEQNMIVDIKDMEPLSEELYYSSKPYRYAVEVNQGYFVTNGISIGDRVEFRSTDSPDNAIIVFVKQSK